MLECGCGCADVKSLVSSLFRDWYQEKIVQDEDESCTVRLDCANAEVIVDVSGFSGKTARTGCHGNAYFAYNAKGAAVRPEIHQVGSPVNGGGLRWVVAPRLRDWIVGADYPVNYIDVGYHALIDVLGLD